MNPFTIERLVWTVIELVGLALFGLGIHVTLSGRIIVGVVAAILPSIPLMVAGLLFGMVAEFGEAYAVEGKNV